MPKRATIANVVTGTGATIPVPDLAGAVFLIRDAATGDTAFSGTLPAGRATWGTDTRDSSRVANFSELTTPGTYYLQVPALGISNSGDRGPNFRIADDVFNTPYRAMMLGMYLWRCGSPVGVSATYDGRTFSHGACHMNDGDLRHAGIGQTGTKDGRGGWHDAGDFNKYVVNSGITNGLLLKAWQDHGETLGRISLLPVNTANAYEEGMPPFLAEVKWNLDWVARMQFDNGQVSHKLTTLRFCDYIMPDQETEENLGEAARRYFTPWSTDATGSFVAQLALASRIFRPYAPDVADAWLEQARVSYDLLAVSASVAAPQNCPTCTFDTGPYGGSDADNRLWAAVEMWETTGEQRYLDDFHSRARTNPGTTANVPNMYSHLGWDGVEVLAGITYLMSERPGRNQERINTIRTDLLGAANGIVTNTNSHGYGRAFGSSSYYWGAHGALTANTYILNTAYKLTGEERYRIAGHEIIGHIFGRNYFGRSFVTGVGHNPPQDPHCRRSIADSRRTGAFMPWPGYLVGGPHTQAMGTPTDPIAPPNATCAAAGVCYFDVYTDYARNEIAINWNASMIYALSGFLHTGPVSIANHTPNNIRQAQTRPRTQTTRLIQVTRNNRTIEIPQGAKIYTLDGRLVAQRRHGEAATPVLRRSGVYVVRIEDEVRR
jgi:endoglucanase